MATRQYNLAKYLPAWYNAHGKEYPPTDVCSNVRYRLFVREYKHKLALRGMSRVRTIKMKTDGEQFNSPITHHKFSISGMY